MAPTTSSPPTTELRRSRRLAGQRTTTTTTTTTTVAQAAASIPSTQPSATSGQKRKQGKASLGSEDTTIASKTGATKKIRTEPPKHEEPPCCSICMSQSGRCQVSTIDSCDHEFCFDCIAEWSKKENSCPSCRARFTEISRVHRARGSTRQNTLRVPDRDQAITTAQQQQPQAAQIVIWGPRHDQEWVFRIPDMPVLLEQDEREAFLHHIFHGAMGAAVLEQPIAVDVYATSHPPPRRRVQPRRSTNHATPSDESNDHRYQVWISNLDNFDDDDDDETNEE